MPTASRARGFNPGHAPHHRGTAVTPPGLGRESPGDLGGRYALQVGVAPQSDAQKAPQEVRGEMRLVSSAGRCLFLLRGLGDGFSAIGRSSQTAGQTARFLPKFTNVAGGSQLSHAMHWPNTFPQNSERTARRVPSEQVKNRASGGRKGEANQPQEQGNNRARGHLSLSLLAVR
jgi:hypothetical protein